MVAEPMDGRSSVGVGQTRFTALLYFDLVDSTGMSNALTATEELDAKSRFHDAVEPLWDEKRVHTEWTGDGALLVFGYPEARVDAPEAAVRTGLRLIEVVQGIVLPRARLQLRVGVACGRVTIMPRKTRTLLARVKPISRAERLMAHAQPGQLLLGEDTRQLVKDFFEYEDLGLVDFQGVGRRRVYRVTVERPVSSRFAAHHPNASTAEIVGRDDVVTRLKEGWASACARKGEAICLVGDSGQGKSRLAQFALEWSRRNDGVPMEIDCTPSTGNTPLFPIGVLFRRLAGISAGASEPEKERAAIELLTPLLGEAKARESLTFLAPLFGIDSSPLPLDKTPDQVRAATIATLTAIVRAMAERAPLALLCEDLHWADGTTAQTIQAVADIVHDLPLLLVATRWPMPVTKIDFDQITASFTTVPIEPLTAANAAELVRTVSRGELTADQVDAIVMRCGGVPLLLEELTRSGIEQADTSAATSMVQRPDSSVPPELQMVVESRLEQWPNLRNIIEAASVLGREFPVSALGSMLTDSRGDVATALARFTEDGLIGREQADDRARFKHALIRDAVYQTLVARDHLRWLHSTAADTLSSGFRSTPDASPEVLAGHLRQAGRLEEAVGIRLVAGDETFKRGAFLEAQGHCDAVRELLQEREATGRDIRPDTLRHRVLVGMVESGIHGYAAEQVCVAYREAEAMFEAQTSAEERYPVVRGLATAALVRGDLSTAHERSQEGLRLAEESQRVDYRIDAMSVLSYTTLYFGRLEDCRTWIERCLALYDAEGGERLRYPVPQDAKTAVLSILPTVAWLLGDDAAAEQAIARGLAHVEALGREFDKALLHAWTAGTRYTQRRYPEALQHAGIAYMLGEQHKFDEWHGVGAMMSLISRCALGASPADIEMAIATAEKFKSRGVGLNASYFLWGIARGFVKLGAVDSANATLAVALAVAEASQETRMHPELWLLQAEIASNGEQAASARRRAFDLAMEHGAVANALRAAAMMLTHDRKEPADAEWALQTLALLDGPELRAGEPAGWMTARLAQAARLIGAASVEALEIEPVVDREIHRTRETIPVSTSHPDHSRARVRAAE